jgi:hypothetical protein
MRWLHIKYSNPVHGEMRQIFKFAWFPKRAGVFVVWLESYSLVEMYHDGRTAHENGWFIMSRGWHHYSGPHVI